MNMITTADMDTLLMNKLWINHSYYSAECCLDDFLDNNNTNLEQFEHLDVMGLFETSWMIYPYHNDQINKNHYGYPGNE